eukprot:286150_1
MLSPLELSSPTIIYQSVAVLDNPFSLPEYKAKATKKQHTPFRLDAHVSNPKIPPTDTPSNAEYLLTIHKYTNEQEMIASMGYSSSRSERHYYATEDEKSLHHHTSCPSLPSKKVNRPNNRNTMNRSKSKTHKRNRKQTRNNNTKLRNLQLEPSDTETYGGPKPYFVTNKPHSPDSPYLALPEDVIVYSKSDTPKDENKRKLDRKKRKFLSIVPKKKYHHKIEPHIKKTVRS